MNLVGTDPKDPTLHQVRVEADGTTIASDGQVTVIVEPIMEQSDDAVSIPPNIVKDVLRTVPTEPLLAFSILDRSKSMVEFKTMNGETVQTVYGHTERKPPIDWKAELKACKSSDSVRIAVNRKSLATLLTMMDKTCPDPEKAAFLEVSEDGIIVRAESTKTGQRVIGCVKPLQTFGRTMEANLWERRLNGIRKKKASRKKSTD